jgi:TPR repeat protein
MMSAADRVPWSNLADLERYAANGNLKACAQLGEQLYRGDGVPQDLARALPLLERAARGGHGPAAFRLGMIYDDGHGVAQDRLRALAYFRAAAAAGEAEAFFNVGAAYVGAHGVKRDYTEGLAWLILAAQRGAGGDTAQTVRARIQKLRHPEWITVAEARAPAIERELAATTAVALLPPAPAGDPAPASSAAPKTLKPDLGSLKPNVPALALPELTAPPIDPPSGPPVNLVLPTGRRVKHADFNALQRAAIGGDPAAGAALGRLLIEGQLTTADPARAVTVLTRAAQAGSADAAHYLAELYTRGVDVARDDAQAFAYNLQAARGGSLQCIFNVGALYANGRGVTRDYTSALAWLIVAKNYGVDRGDSAARIRTHLQKNAPAEITVAEQRAAAFIREIEPTRSR